MDDSEEVALGGGHQHLFHASFGHPFEQRVEWLLGTDRRPSWLHHVLGEPRRFVGPVGGDAAEDHAIGVLRP